MSSTTSATPTVSTRLQVARLLGKLLVFCILLLIGLEIAVRIIGHYDKFGQFSVFHVQLPPYAMRIGALERQLPDYGADGNSRVIYDPAAGYTLRPNWTSGDGLYFHNADGIRAATTSTEYTQQPADDVLRIATFGDSFVLGGRVPYEDSWDYLLEQDLKNRGINAEVIDFGVNGYTLAQALRHYETQGVNYDPDIVIYGFRGGHISQTMEIINALENHSAEPFTLPRYVLQDDDLVLVNNPTLTPEQVLEILRDPDSNPFKAYEPPPESSLTQLLYKSRFLTLLTSSLSAESDLNFTLQDERTQLFLATVDEFAQEAEAEDSHFMVLHFITPGEQQQYVAKGDPLPYPDVITTLQNRYDYIELQPAFRQAYSSEDWVESHYSRRAGLRIVPLIADSIEACVDTPECDLPRYQD